MAKKSKERIKGFDSFLSGTTPEAIKTKVESEETKEKERINISLRILPYYHKMAKLEATKNDISLGVFYENLLIEYAKKNNIDITAFIK